MITLERKNKKLVEALRREHRRLAEQVAGIEWILHVDFDWDDLESVLEDTQETISIHFTFEEMQGFPQVVASSSNYSEVAEQLQAEHRRLEKELRSVLTTVRERTDRKAVREKLEEWLKSLRTHESRENSFFIEIHARDVGCAD